jgi:16S rRNA (guanine(966)-N(2))-methyltransferase RsmD
MGRLRVISGSARGVRLQLVPGNSTRPIGDRVKEALFNILADDLLDARFLDLFAGTGSVGIEALSRGCERTVFIESHAGAVETIRSNLELAKVAMKGQVIQIDVFQWIKSAPEAQFDFVFLAPPQYKGLWDRTVRALDQNTGRLNPDALVIAQLDPKEYEALRLEQLEEFDQRKYGRTLLVFYEFAGQ